ncbi:Hypothetical protein ERS075553_04837 [Mycobacteroides abscessus]|uniref:DUF4333 domain-containing protein n=2 Tax=Mycobacteriaceae TaxID=1762 RepID=A0AB73TZL9_MYCCH|nr:DUF4333 domain-containing protein [Mycobacteroides chelonae]CPS21788.1 Hypothetical protein ERS075499_04981 [Mycobacteroides abscessus]CPS56243.1 Hypothetical protein ERS075503_05276 [Mycobacteroides abscessus]CPT32913.1 Hypothetical protein ERS075523_04879 [Mycobacteroides abscessus]CPU50117.1 Hypothetical protein ERS075553_04837 [Mycobacteroides abscessus]
MKAMVWSTLAIGALLLTGCNVSLDIGTREIDKDKLAVGVTNALRDKTGETVTSSKCDGPLRGEKGAKQRCWITNHKGEYFGVTTTTTSLDDRGIYFDVDVDAQPTSQTSD